MSHGGEGGGEVGGRWRGSGRRRRWGGGEEEKRGGEEEEVGGVGGRRLRERGDGGSMIQGVLFHGESFTLLQHTGDCHGGS